MTAAKCRWLELLGELVVRGVWADEGARTPGAWLSWKLGIGAATGREHVRVALRLRDLPAVRERFAAGTLSSSKVRAITRIAVPEAEELLVMWADHATATQMETIVRGLRTSQRARATEPAGPDDPRYRESVRVHADGTATLTIRGPAEEIVAVSDGLRLLAEVLVADRLDVGGPGPADRPSPGVAGPGGTATQRSTEDPGPRRTTAADRVEALGHVVAAAVSVDAPPDTSGLDRTTLVLQVEAADEAVEPTDGPDVVRVRDAHGRIRAMDRRALRRLACDAGRVTATIGASDEPLDLGRRRRDTSAALRRAVHLRRRQLYLPRLRRDPPPRRPPRPLLVRRWTHRAAQPRPAVQPPPPLRPPPRRRRRGPSRRPTPLHPVASPHRATGRRPAPERFRGNAAGA